VQVYEKFDKEYEREDRALMWAHGLTQSQLSGGLHQLLPVRTNNLLERVWRVLKYERERRVSVCASCTCTLLTHSPARYDVLALKLNSRLDDLLVAIIDKLLPQYHAKLLSSASRPNPKLTSQVLPRVERAKALLEKWGADAVVAVLGQEEEGEYLVKSSSGEKQYGGRLSGGGLVSCVTECVCCAGTA
jgi:hypothetical protein